MSAKKFGVYASGERVYWGDFSEVPQPCRRELAEAVELWGDVVDRRGLNEIFYSFLCWHDETVFRCGACGFTSPSEKICPCGKTLERKPKYERSEKISRLLLCVGSINKVVVEESG